MSSQVSTVCVCLLCRFCLRKTKMKFLQGLRTAGGLRFWHFLQLISFATIFCTIILSVYQVSSGYVVGVGSTIVVDDVDLKRSINFDDNSVNSFSSDDNFNGHEDYNPLGNNPPSRNELLNSLFLSVKTTKKFHESRLEPILQTWFNLAKDQTYIFTDADDPELDRRTNGHIINTHCPSTHYRNALCCKFSMEFDTFLQTTKSWFCHFDDDNYVNVPALLDLLGKYNHREYWYLGKPSLKGPIHILNPERSKEHLNAENRTEEIDFWFATGGAGFCLSRALALRMSPLASGGKFLKVCDRIQLPDDVSVGYIAGHLLGQNLTVIPQFHSHFETMKFIDMKSPQTEITFSYVRYGEYENILDIEGFPQSSDPTRFLSLHCTLFPNFSLCSQFKTTTKFSRKRKR